MSIKTTVYKNLEELQLDIYILEDNLIQQGRLEMVLSQELKIQ